MLPNQALAGQEAQSFAQRTRCSSEDFVRCELAAVEHFESNLQKDCDAQLHTRMHALQDECRDRVSGVFKNSTCVQNFKNGALLNSSGKA